MVYDRYHRQLLSFCRHMLGRAAEAEDAVQQTFISAYGDLRRSERPVALRAWLFTIARNRCLSMLRSRRETASLEDVEPETAGLAAEVQHRDELRTMLGDISRLPEEQRTALVLAELGDLDHAEIAGVIGCSKDKVKALVFQARSSLSLSRQARETSCEEIRGQLSTLRGGALRRAGLRRHLRECAGCRDFRDEVRRQRAAMAVLLPVVPAVGLKKAVLSGAGLSTGSAAAGGGAAGLGLAGAKLAAVKAAAVVAIVGAGAVGGEAIVKRIDGGSSSAGHATPASRAASHRSAAGAAGTSAAAAAAAAASGASNVSGAAAAHSHRAAAHANALAHGRGLKRGLRGTQPGQNRTSTSSTLPGRGVGRGGNGHGSTGLGGSNGNAGGNGKSQSGSSGGSSNESHSNSSSHSNSTAAAPVDPAPTTTDTTGTGAHGKSGG